MNGPRAVTLPPISPAATSVARAPMHAAIGSVSANEIGTRPIEMNQSKLETQPKMRGHDVGDDRVDRGPEEGVATAVDGRELICTRRLRYVH